MLNLFQHLINGSGKYRFRNKFGMTSPLKVIFEITSIISFCIALLISFSGTAQQNPSQYVNPFIGTGGHGHAFPGAVVPFGMVQLSPDTRIDGSWDGCSGYHYSDSIIYGFSHTHLSGTGISDYGDIMLMPTLGKAKYKPSEYASTFSHKNEKAEAGYYSVKLDNGVKTELTTTTRVGIHRYTFPKTDSANLVFDLMHRDVCTEAMIVIQSNTRVVGYRKSTAWATDQYISFVMQFSQPFEDRTIVSGDGRVLTSNTITDPTAKINFRFKSTGKPVLVKVALSSVGPDGAQNNMTEEMREWKFENVRDSAKIAWNLELGKIEVQSPNRDDLVKFYTALYHAFTHPSAASDVDGRYRGLDKKIYTAEGYTHYSVFSLWDTFRALHPLMTLVDRERTNSFVQTFLNMYEQGGRLPVWELASNETDCMIGYHSASVITDAAVKGIGNFNRETALQAMIKSATWPHLGLPAYISTGVLTIDDEHESVSKTLEYAYDDWCIAQMAKLRGDNSTYTTFIKRAHHYKNIFDPETGLMRPKKNGGWLTPFEPREVNNHFTEANSWQYSFFVPHDISGHIQLMGGVEKFEKQLDRLFTESSQTTGRDQADITGLIGQYAHGNEPSHHMAYLYNYIGKPEKTQQRIREILTTLYHNAPDGLSGNEDCGQMSAWFVLSSLGLYQVTPGTTDFVFGSPLFTRSTIRFENGNSLKIESPGNNATTPYIRSASLNDISYNKSFIDYNDLLNGGTLKFTMDFQPGITFGKSASSIPSTSIDASLWVTNPIITAPSKSFKETTEVSLSASAPAIYYTIDGTTPTASSTLYKKPIAITETTTVKTIAVDGNGNKSYPAEAAFYKMPANRKVALNSKYSPQYSAGGDEGIIDGIRGTENWRKGEWQGYQNQNFEAVIDLSKVQSIQEVGAGFLQDTRAWILMPTRIEVSISKDGTNFTKVADVVNTVKPEDYTTQVKDFVATLGKKTKARYVKVTAFNFGKLPPWHQGYPFSGDAYIFTDEVWVK